MWDSVCLPTRLVTKSSVTGQHPAWEILLGCAWRVDRRGSAVQGTSDLMKMEVHWLLKCILRKEKALRHSAPILEDQAVCCCPFCPLPLTDS